MDNPTTYKSNIAHHTDVVIGKTFDSWLSALQNTPTDQRLNNLLFIDTETSHLNGWIVSIALVMYSLKDEKIINKEYMLLNPQEQMDQEAMSVHGIREEDIANSPTFGEVLPKIEKIITSADMVVAFNAIYDVSALVREYERVGKIIPRIYYLDLMKRIRGIIKAKNANGRLKDPKLSEAAAFLGIDYQNKTLHNALDDTLLLVEVFEKLYKKFNKE